MEKKVVLDRLIHRGANHLAIRFEKDRDLISLLKKIRDVRFSKSHRCWYLPATTENHLLLIELLHGAAVIVDDASLRVAGEAVVADHVEESLQLLTQKLALKVIATIPCEHT